MTILIIPGYGGKPRDKISLRFKRELKKHTVHVFSPSWKKMSINLWIKELEKYVRKNNLYASTVMAHSFGSIVVMGAKIKPAKLIIASLSPYLKKDLHSIDDEDKKFFGKKMLKELSKLKIINKPTVIFAGSKEDPRITKYASKIVKGAGHIPVGKYFKVIIKELNRK